MTEPKRDWSHIHDKRRWHERTPEEQQDVIAALKHLCVEHSPSALSQGIGSVIFLVETALPRCPDAVASLRAAYDAEVVRAEAFMASIKKARPT